MDAKIFRINYKSDFILTLESDAGWMTPFCIKFWTGAPSQAYYVGWDGETYNHCSFDPSEPTKLQVQFDDHHLPIGDLKYQVAYHFTVSDFPEDTEDEVINPANITTEIDGETYQVMLDFTGETAPEIQFALPAYANEAQRIANEQQRIAAETQRIANEETRIANEQTRINQEQTRQQNEQQRINQEQARVNEYATLKADAVAATGAANDAAALANQKAQLAAHKAALAQDAANLANAKAQLAADKAALAASAAQLANDKAALAQQKAEYAQQQGSYAKDQGDYAKNQGDYAKEQGDTALADHQRAEADHGIAVDDHTQAGNDHTRAESDHGIAVDDHTQAGNDHTRAESDHGIAADDHTQAGNDHTRAESDHTRAESDHAAVEVYVDSLGAFDISAYHATGGVLAKYVDLTAALGTNGANIPDALRKGGMSVKFVCSSDNKYVQYRCISDEFTTDVTKWQGVDVKLVAGSDNLTKSRSVIDFLAQITGLKAVFDKVGWMYANGVLANTATSISSSGLYMIKGLSKLEFKLALNNQGQIVSFFDENGEYLSDISITASDSLTPKDYTGVIDLTNEDYSDAVYVGFSCRNYDDDTYYVKIGNIITEEIETAKKDINDINSEIGIDADFDIPSKAYSGGVLIDTAASIKSSKKYYIKGFDVLIYSLNFNNTGQVVSFFDENGDYLSSISITASSSASAIDKKGIIYLNDTAYSSVAYVAFTCRNYAEGSTYNAFVGKFESLKNRLRNIEAANLGNRANFTIPSSAYSNGVITSSAASVQSTERYYIKGLDTIIYNLNLNNSGQIISFFDEDGDYLSEISVNASDSVQAKDKSGVIDLTGAAYSDVAYVGFTCRNFAIDSPYYAIFGKVNNMTEEIHILNHRSSIAYKKLCALGDSITDGAGNNNVSWYDMLQSRYNIKDVLDFAESGQCLRTMADLCTAENMANIDICFVMGGTNQLSNFRLGTIDDEPTPDRWQANKAYSVGDKVLGGTLEEHGITTHIKAYLYWYECVTAGTSGNTADASAFNTTLDSITTDGTVEWKCIGNPSWYSDMKGICRRVWGFNPKIQIIWLVPIKCKSDASYNDPASWQLAAKFDAVRKFCKGYSIRCIDLQKEFQLNEWTKNTIMTDEHHPNKRGYEILCDIVCSFVD